GARGGDRGDHRALDRCAEPRAQYHSHGRSRIPPARRVPDQGPRSALEALPLRVRPGPERAADPGGDPSVRGSRHAPRRARHAGGAALGAARDRRRPLVRLAAGDGERTGATLVRRCRTARGGAAGCASAGSGARAQPNIGADADIAPGAHADPSASAYALRGVLAQHPHLLAVPIRESAEYDEGRLAASYFLLFEHVEHQSPSFVQTAVERAIAQAGGAAAPEALGRALYGLLVADGRLRETYAAFVADAMGTAIPQPGFWADVGIVEHEDATDIVTRAGRGVGDPHEQSRRVTDQKTRSAEWQFAVTPGPLTARFFYVRSGDLKSPRDV